MFDSAPASPTPEPAAWTLEGKALPFASSSDLVSGDLHPADAPNSVIPVEQIKGSIFTVSGELDTVWKSCGYSDAITARLSAHRVDYPRTALRYPDAGHPVGGMNVFLNLATTRGEGGTVNTNAMAADAGYSRLLAWLANE